MQYYALINCLLYFTDFSFFLLKGIWNYFSQHLLHFVVVHCKPCLADTSDALPICSLERALQTYTELCLGAFLSAFSRLPWYNNIQWLRRLCKKFWWFRQTYCNWAVQFRFSRAHAKFIYVMNYTPGALQWHLLSGTQYKKVKTFWYPWKHWAWQILNQTL